MTAPPRPRINPRKLLLSKWTATTPRDKEKHFLVTRLVPPLAPSEAVELVELEAVHSGRSQVLSWRELADVSLWRQGWL